MLNLFKPAPSAPPITDSQLVRQSYRYWQTRILYTSLIGYALFYLLRKNLSLAMPVMETSMGIGKDSLGLFLTLNGLLYGLSKFTNGMLGDRTNPRYFMALGLFLSAVANLAFGFSSAVWILGIIWMLNGWFQGMGFPPCARSLTHWFAADERATRFAIWNTSHSVGTAAVLILCSTLIAYGYSWPSCFVVPALIGLGGTIFLLERLRDTPSSLGLPMIEDFTASTEVFAPPTSCQEEPPFKDFVVRQVFLNPFIWFVSFANFFVYTVRYAFLDWGPTLLKEMRGCELSHTGWIVASYEVAGLVGMLLTGWLTDRLFGGRAARACVVSMILCTGCVFVFWKMGTSSPLANVAVLAALGFLIYGPQCLVGVIAANLATRRAAATAIGVTGLLGYMSGILSGWGLGVTVKHFGWNPVFQILIAAGLIAAALFALCWNVPSRPR